MKLLTVLIIATVVQFLLFVSGLEYYAMCKWYTYLFGRCSDMLEFVASFIPLVIAVGLGCLVGAILEARGNL